jgi:hypothetical protein
MVKSRTGFITVCEVIENEEKLEEISAGFEYSP